MKRKYFLIAGTIIVLCGMAFIGYQRYKNRQEEIRMAEEQREIAEAYRWIHHAIGELETDELGAWAPFIGASELEMLSMYQPLESLLFRPNEHGISTRIYLILRMYYHRGGVYLSYEKLIDYFTAEFEPDGTLRLYNNGHHPEIEAFVVWMREGLRSVWNGGERWQYMNALEDINQSYVERTEGFEHRHLHQLSPQMIDALARAESDPDYELDLTSLQEAGY